MKAGNVMTSTSVEQTLRGIRADIAHYTQTLWDRPFQPPSIPNIIDGEEGLIDDDTTAMLCNCILLIAFYTDAAVVEITRKGQHLVASYSEAPQPVPQIVMPARVAPRLIMRLINMIADRWTRNEALELEGIITYRWGPGTTKYDYVANVHIWPVPEGFHARIRLTLEGEARPS